MTRYKISNHAFADLIAIYEQGYNLFGEKQADAYHSDLTKTFELLALFPGMAQKRHDIHEPIHVHPHRSHIILYDVTEDGIEIIRIRHAHEDWLNPESPDDNAAV